MTDLDQMTIPMLLIRLVLAAIIGSTIGYERRLHHKVIGVAGMVLVALGSTTYMLLAKHEAANDPASISRAIQGILQGIGFLGGAVIFKGGTDVRGIKTAAAVWITGAIGLAIGTGFWWLGVLVGFATAAILFIADRLPVAGRQGEGDSQAAQPGDEAGAPGQRRSS